MKQTPTATPAVPARDSHLPQILSRANSAGRPEGHNLTLRSQRARAEALAIRRALSYAGWNRKQAARLLEISYRGILHKIRQHNITRESSSNVFGEEPTQLEQQPRDDSNTGSQ